MKYGRMKIDGTPISWALSSLILITTKIIGFNGRKTINMSQSVVIVVLFVSICGSKGPRYMQPKMVLKSLPVPWVRLVGKI